MFIGRVSPSVRDRINKSFSPFSVAFSIRTPLNPSERPLIARRRKRGRKEVVHNSINLVPGGGGRSQLHDNRVQWMCRVQTKLDYFC